MDLRSDDGSAGLLLAPAVSKPRRGRLRSAVDDRRSRGCPGARFCLQPGTLEPLDGPTAISPDPFCCSQSRTRVRIDRQLCRGHRTGRSAHRNGNWPGPSRGRSQHGRTGDPRLVGDTRRRPAGASRHHHRYTAPWHLAGPLRPDSQCSPNAHRQSLVARSGATRARRRFAKFTCCYSHCDNIVFPASTATLPGATNLHIPGTAHVHLAFQRKCSTSSSLGVSRATPHPRSGATFGRGRAFNETRRTSLRRAPPAGRRGSWNAPSHPPQRA